LAIRALGALRKIAKIADFAGRAFNNGDQFPFPIRHIRRSRDP
jgi:hypothetical protein